MTTIKKSVAAICVMILALLTAGSAYAAPEDSYTYSYWGDPVPSPSPYAAVSVLYGKDMGVDSLNMPQDMFVSTNGDIYIADTGNNRILVLDSKWQVTRTITEFDNNGAQDALNGPEGIYVSEQGDLYIADTLNKRVLQLSKDGKAVLDIRKPESSLIRSGFEYTPTKIAVDREGQIYTVSRGSYEGIMMFDSDGAFEGFIGTNRVKFNPIDLFWKRISTKEQRSQMEMFVPLEFNNLSLDEDGFIFATTSEENSDSPVKRLNPSGVDILRSKGYFPVKGDINTLQVSSAPGSSIMIDVASDKGGMYSLLDSKRGRIFTYDKEGNLLYVYGGLGSKIGKFRTPSAFQMLGERMLVLDKGLNRLTVLEPTEYGMAVRDAVTQLYNGQVEASTEAWQRVLALNGNNDVAYIGIGKSLLKQGDNAGAMSYFQLGNHREWYSEAFKRFRKDILMENFGTIVMTIVLGIAAIVGAVKLFTRRVEGHYDEVGVIRNPFYTMIHPFNGFWEMKYEKKGRVKIALLLVILLVIFTIIKKQYSGFVVNMNNLADMNSLQELQYIALPFLLWCVANWSLTTLMDGEGKFKDIVMATGYALMPLVIILIPQTLLSNVMTQGESALYYLLDGIAYAWCLALLFVGTMTVHQYSPGKTLATMLLTLVVIGIILFLSLLFFSMMQQIVNFVVSIYREISFRM
ncbi:YIP1 family protein [Paenibacillus aquistagni]|uniref:NHL repeat-containing protein n=1 Tax=Paenibacillus aquistagni TaxID=1852522 RepID=A0A1X7LW06_9BACL|nr:YIP1 family protein [Paenibacillus aquistagni]SMG58025.1 NHL repeat-containing protein [Paenibacillus aquistagni]